jgi:stage II sporulation protein M
MNLLNYYRQLFAENRRWIIWSLRWFLVSFTAGVVGFFVNPDLMDSIAKIFSDKFGATPSLDIHLAQAIFIQNSIAVLFALLGGAFVGISSLVALITNGFLIGFIITMLIAVAFENPLTGFGLLIGGLVPHGIFELPAFFIASAFGMKLGLAWFKSKAQGNRWGIWKQSLREVITILPLLILLLAVAAVIEVFISGFIVDKF